MISEMLTAEKYVCTVEDLYVTPACAQTILIETIFANTVANQVIPDPTAGRSEQRNVHYTERSRWGRTSASPRSFRQKKMRIPMMTKVKLGTLGLS